MYQRTRIYYRNQFLHIGHLQTLFHNDNIAKQHGGTCHAIIDDRQDPDRVQHIQEDFNYLELKNTNIVSVQAHQEKILAYTIKLVQEGLIYLNYCSTNETDPNKIADHIRDPKIHFRLLLRSGSGFSADHPSIGYTKCSDDRRLTIVFLFDYIIKVLDNILNITDIISTAATDISDVRDPVISSFFDTLSSHIKCHRLDTYYIQGFKYSKKDWPCLDERDPYLLTIKGLKSRHVPRIVLYAFYLHASQMGIIKITYLSTLLGTYLNRVSDRAFGVLNPVKVTLDAWPENYTEYVCRSINPLKDTTELQLCPLSRNVYIDTSDCGLDNINKLTKGRYCRLKYGQYLHCLDIEEKGGQLSISAETVPSTDRARRTIHWISSVYGQEPISVIYVLYNWFYTGQNTMQKPGVVRGYIERSAFSDLKKIYLLERLGYFIYDNALSYAHGVPTFVRICKM